MRTATAAKDPGKAAGRAGREGGFMLVLTLLVLFTLTLVGMTSLINATIDTKIAANENNANRALYAADAGLAHALTMLNNTTVTPVYTDVNWSYPTDHDTNRSTKVEASGDYTVGALQPRQSMYRWYMQFKQDTEDLDTDGNTTELVYFNKHFHYQKSVFTGSGGNDGYPVIEVISEGIVSAGGASSDPLLAEKRLSLEIGRNIYNVHVEGAVTSRSNANFTGNFGASGLAHNTNGALCTSNPNPPCACTDAKPAVFVDTGMVPDISHKPGNFTGTPTAAQVNPDARWMPSTPWEVLGIDPADAPPETAPGAVVSPFSGMVWCAGSINIDNGTGILIVHNRNFNPNTWAASDPASAKYSPNVGDAHHADYLAIADSSKPGYDATYSPAKFGANSNGTIKGVIIADMVDKINGTNQIIGAVISLTEVEAGTFGNGTADISYSCDAINANAQIGYSTKLVWRRL